MRPRGLDPGPGPRRGDDRTAARLQRLLLIEAVKYNVLPLDVRRIERLKATSPGARS